MADEGVERSRITALRRAHVKYQGTDAPLPVEFGDASAIRERFETAHRQRFGFVMAEKPLIVEAVSVEIVGAGDVDDEAAASMIGGKAMPRGETTMFSGGVAHRAATYDRAALRPGETLDGPAIVVEANATTVVEPGWQARIDARRNLILERAVRRPDRAAVGTAADPVMLEVFNHLFMAIAEQMGTALQCTAYSVNIKERLDFSCALFDRTGSLVANAPHIPVHLGSMGESVRTIIRAHGLRDEEGAGSGRRMRPGDVYVLNAPYNGGTHLPDVTVITPVFARGGSRRTGAAAVLCRVARPSRRYRRHHAGLDAARTAAASRKKAC